MHTPTHALRNAITWNEAKAERAAKKGLTLDAERHRANAEACWIRLVRLRRAGR